VETLSICSKDIDGDSSTSTRPTNLCWRTRGHTTGARNFFFPRREELLAERGKNFHFTAGKKSARCGIAVFQPWKEFFYNIYMSWCFNENENKDSFWSTFAASLYVQWAASQHNDSYPTAVQRQLDWFCDGYSRMNGDTVTFANEQEITWFFEPLFRLFRAKGRILRKKNPA